MRILSMAAVSAVLVLTISACSDDPTNGEPVGEVSATLDGTTYVVPVHCWEREGEVNMASVDDPSGVKINALQMGEKLNLDIFVGDDEYSTPNLDDWQRTADGLRGSGRLVLDGEEIYREYPVTFRATCNE